MTISSTTRVAGPFAGSGTVATFPFTFKVFAEGDLLVERLDIASGVATTLTLTADYTVALNGDQDTTPGGTITLTAGNLATGQRLVITSDLPNLQPVEITNQGGFYPDVINDSLDRATIQIQQLEIPLDRSLKFAVTDPTVDPTLPSTEVRAGKLLGFDDAGTPEAVVPVSVFPLYGIVTIPYSATPVIDASKGSKFSLLLTGNAAPTFTNGGGASVFFSIRVIQDATGGRLLTWPANMKNMGTINSAPNSVSEQFCSIDADGTAWGISPMMAAPVNGVFVVTNYGAKGDDTTNDHDAIQAAIDAAYDVGGAVYFPANPRNAGQTVYYTATAVNPKGVSLFGDPMAQGTMQSATGAMKVAIRGGVGQDILCIVRPGGAGFADPWTSWTIKDLGLILDTSTDASASFPTRLPGRRFDDAAMNGSNAVLTSAAQGVFMPGDVGQHISVTGAGPAGATLVTTIASYQSKTQVTLTAASSTAVSGAHGYISVLDLPVTQTVGNCAFAMDDPNAAYAPGFNANFENVVVENDSNHYTNYGCGFFFQGNGCPYAGNWTNVFSGVPFGFVFVQANGVTASGSNYTGIADHNHFTNVWILAEYPWLSYNGGANEIKNLKIFTNAFGPQILNAYGAETDAHEWKIDIPEAEGGGASASTIFRIAGTNHTFDRLSLGGNAAQAFQWDADSSRVIWMALTTYATFNVTGGMNDFYSTSYADSISGATFNVTGFGNTLTTGKLSNPLVGLQPARKQFAYKGSTTFGPPALSRGSTVYNRTRDFIDKGAATYYFNGEDLWFWPQEMGNAVAGSNPVLAADATSSSGYNFKVASGGGQYLSTSNGTEWFIGSQIPAGKMRIYFWMKAASTTNVTLLAQANESSVWTTLTTATVSVSSSSYALYSIDVDATGLSGDAFLINISAATVDVYVAWVGIRPWGDTLSTGVQVGVGTSTLYRCVGGTLDGQMVWKASVCTGAGGTAVSTGITTP